MLHRYKAGMLQQTGLLMGMAVVFLVAGCGYTTRGLYPTDIRTIAVPIFESRGLRRDFEFQLTEKVIQKIEAQTPFKVVSEPEADTVLRGTIVNLFKSPFGEDGFDNPRGGTINLNLTLTWTDKRTGEVLNETNQIFTLNSIEPYTIDLAESEATALAATVDKMSNHIVTMLQAPW